MTPNQPPAAECAELKPCPFCGEQVYLIQQSKDGLFYILHSKNVTCYADEWKYSNKAALILKWNTRHFPSLPADRVCNCGEGFIGSHHQSCPSFKSKPPADEGLEEIVEQLQRDSRTCISHAEVKSIILSALNQAVAKVTKERDEARQNYSKFFLMCSGLVQRLSNEKFKPEIIEHIQNTVNMILIERDQLLLDKCELKKSLKMAHELIEHYECQKDILALSKANK